MKNAVVKVSRSELTYSQKLEVLFEIPAGSVAMMGHWNNDTGCVAGLAEIDLV